MSNPDHKRYDDFLHTAKVVVARAVAEHERSAGAIGHIAARRVTGRHSVVALAAASATGISLPTGEITANGGQLGIRLEPIEGKVKVTLQLKGFSAITANANRPGRLFSANGAVDSHFQFDGRGKAMCVVLDAPEVREGLLACDVEIFEADA